ncbi:EcsC family protein [soil metagenome]
MGVTRSIGRQLAPRVVPRVTQLAPGLSASFVREALHRAIDGAGPFAAATKVAERLLDSNDGDADEAIDDVIDQHIRYAGVQGFATNLGGLVTMTVAVPANITGLAVLQDRMVAAIAHLRGYDLTDPRVHNAILVATIGEDDVHHLVKRGKLPAPPMALATAPVHDPSIDALVSAEVAGDLITRVAGKRLATTMGRRIPVIGGIVGMGTDGWSTYKIGHYAAGEFLPRRPR